MRPLCPALLHSVLPLVLIGITPGPGLAAQDPALEVFRRRCLPCHGAEPGRLRGGLDLRTREAARRGGASGALALVPGDPDASLIYQAVSGAPDVSAMPPEDEPPLAPGDADLIRAWIERGAPWPSQVPQPPRAGVVVSTSGGQSRAWDQRPYDPADLWAFVPPRAASTHPIDHFILQRLRAAGVSGFAPPASRRALIRRATFDLLGLPPTQREVDDFRVDDGPNAYERLLDRLLASPHYGEQQARHWLDVTRYADTAGMANDFELPNAWRYRDYVVRSFNRDTPFDRFVLEQVAGDELAPDDPEMKVAVGFLRMGPWEHTSMTVAAVTRQQWLDDVTNAVGVTFLGLGLRCAGCHDHKFDPIPTRDYYRVQAAFAGTHPAEMDVPFSRAEPRGPAFEQRRREALARLKETNEVLAAYDGSDPIAHKRVVKRREYEVREAQRYASVALTVYSGAPNGYVSTRPINLPAAGAGTMPFAHVLAGGSIEAPGERVAPGALSMLPVSFRPGPPAFEVRMPDAPRGQRLALARWIADRKNPLTARVIVNRVWQWHFGRGLVATPNTFGKMGARPTHPELLDHLASWFMDNGWSVKRLHRLIMTSAAYRQSGARDDMARVKAADPRSELLAFFAPRRLAAEELRDALLVASGDLDPTPGGPGGFPVIDWEVALQPRQIMGTVAPPYIPSPRPAERNRRSLYLFRGRGVGDPFMEVFNRPTGDNSCGQRDETTVAPQAFALWNGEQVHDRALALAQRLEREETGTAARLTRLVQIVYGRPPSTAELKLLSSHLRARGVAQRGRDIAPVRPPRQIERRMVEERTGQMVRWTETLDRLQAYEPDTKPWQVGPGTRALAELCIVLFNSNEFVHLR